MRASSTTKWSGPATPAAPAKKLVRCNIEYVDKIVDMRRHLVQEEARFPAGAHAYVFKGLETQGESRGASACRQARRVGRRPQHSPRWPRSPMPSTCSSSAAPAPSTIATKKITKAVSPDPSDHAGVRLRDPRQGRALQWRYARAVSATSTCTSQWPQMADGDLRRRRYQREEGHRRTARTASTPSRTSFLSSVVIIEVAARITDRRRSCIRDEKKINAQVGTATWNGNDALSPTTTPATYGRLQRYVYDCPSRDS